MPLLVDLTVPRGERTIEAAFEAAANETVAVLPPSSSANIGASASAGAFNTMIVSLDELGVFLTNLSTSEVTAIYNGGLGETCCPLGP